VAGASLTLAEWRTAAPGLAGECADEWGLRLGEPYVPGATGHVVRAEFADGTPAVLKLLWPHLETVEWLLEDAP